MERKATVPAIVITNDDGQEVIVKVGSLDLDGISRIVEHISAADLPLPDLQATKMRAYFQDLQDKLYRGAEVSAQELQQYQLSWVAMILDTISSNLPVIIQWLFRTPDVLRLFVAGATALPEATIGKFTAAQTIRAARACITAMREEGTFEELYDFFGELVGKRSLPPGRKLSDGASAGTGTAPNPPPEPSQLQQESSAST